MDRTPSRPKPAAEPVRRKRIGFIGKGDIDPRETGLLWYLGRCLAAGDREVVIIPAKGAAAAVIEGVEREKGTVHNPTTDVIGVSDLTLLYLDTPLLERIKKLYPDLEKRPDALIIDNLPLLVDSVIQVLTERGITPP